MRKPFEKIVDELRASSDRDEEMGLTLGELGTRHHCSPERIADALDCLKMLAGKRTYVIPGWRQRLTREAAEDAGLGGPPYPSDYERGAK